MAGRFLSRARGDPHKATACRSKEIMPLASSAEFSGHQAHVGHTGVEGRILQGLLVHMWDVDSVITALRHSRTGRFPITK